MWLAVLAAFLVTGFQLGFKSWQRGLAQVEDPDWSKTFLIILSPFPVSFVAVEKLLLS